MACLRFPVASVLRIHISEAVVRAANGMSLRTAVLKNTVNGEAATNSAIQQATPFSERTTETNLWIRNNHAAQKQKAISLRANALAGNSGKSFQMQAIRAGNRTGYFVWAGSFG